MDPSYIQWQTERLQSDPEGDALVWRDNTYSRNHLLNTTEEIYHQLLDAKISGGSTVALLGDYSLNSIAAFLALIRLNSIIVPLAPSSEELQKQALEIAQVDYTFDSETSAIEKQGASNEKHPLIEQLRKDKHPGLVLFSSGSTGEPKAILHDLESLLSTMRKPGKAMRTLSFLLFDHIGGIKTLFHTLTHNGCLVIPNSRTVSEVCRVIDKHQIELLPTSPTFLNLLLLENAAQGNDLSSLKLITYGTETMPDQTLQRSIQAMPEAQFKQTYGSSEMGILRSRSASNHSLMIQLGGNEEEIKTKDGRLFIRSSGAMLGYLNAESPFDEDGWFDTGDQVIEENGYLRILGRESDLINVGGQKVFPIEVENVISELEAITSVTVRGEDHLLTGQTVVAEIQTELDLSTLKLKKLIKAHCKDRLQAFMIPTKVYKAEGTKVTSRFKKDRKTELKMS